MNHRVLFLVCGLWSTSLTAQTTDSLAWMRRPSVREVRSIVEDVRRKIANGSLTRRDTTVHCDETNVDATYHLFVDRRGRIRRVAFEDATEDQGERTTLTYDSTGRLRLALDEQATASGSEGESWMYFGPTGALLHEGSRTTKGDGWPWNPPEPITDPYTQLAGRCQD